METYIITEKDIDENGYCKKNFFDGNLVININGLCKFKYLTVSGFIKADGSIEADGCIKADSFIKAEGCISAKMRVFAGLTSWRLPEEDEKVIKCEKLESGEVCYGNLIETR